MEQLHGPEGGEWWSLRFVSMFWDLEFRGLFFEKKYVYISLFSCSDIDFFFSEHISGSDRVRGTGSLFDALPLCVGAENSL